VGHRFVPAEDRAVKLIPILALAGALTAATGFSRPPLGLDTYLPVPLANPLTREKVALGRKLFFDKRLSRDGTLSCASCHDPKLAFSDGRTIAKGIGGARGTRNSPALINRGYGTAFFWDGRSNSLEQLALEPILDPKELGSTVAHVERQTRLRAVDVANALSSYMRTIRSGDSRFDRYTAGETRALNALERQGLQVFRDKGGCTSCHAGPNLTDERFHNTGVAWNGGEFLDEGRFAVSGVERDRGAFKTPTLRDLSMTAPYMHDGSLRTLEEVVDFYSDGGRATPNLDPLITPRRLSTEDKHALVAFLLTLTGRVREGS
jgi:cytochrome c peroxidase